MKLPPEILSLICGPMSKKTLKCVRMACKALEQAAIPFLSDEVFLSSTYFDFEVANHVTTHFAQHIKTITFVSRHFPNYTETQLTKLLQFEPSGWSRDFIEDHEHDAFAAYCKMRVEHDKIIKSGELLAQLRKLLMRLPAVRKLALTVRGCGFMYKSNQFYSHHLWKSRDFCPRGPCTRPPVHHARYHIAPESAYKNDHPNLWHLIMRALSIADPPITEIVSKSTQYSCLIPMGSFVMTPRQMQDVTMRFRTLTKLRLSLSNEDTNQNEGALRYVDDNSVARALSAAVNLKNLFIQNDGDIRSTDDTWSFGSVILEGCRFPELRSLILVNIDTEEEKLLNLLGASPRLENLFLCSFALYAGFWASAAARMKSILHLKNVEITDFSDDLLSSPKVEPQYVFNSDHRLIEDFFLREGENPFTEQAIKDFYNNYDEAQRWEINEGVGDYEKHFETYH